MGFDFSDIFVAFVIGLALGACYLAVLWGSVRNLMRSRHPLPWLLGGATLRIAALLALFYLVMDGRWERLVACLAGFVALRFAVSRWKSGDSALGQPR